MKKCPSCEKTFEDSMRFCQFDGTPLVDDAPAFDPYATIVAPSGVSAPVEDAPAAVEPEAPIVPEPEVMSIEPIETSESEAATQIADYPAMDAPIAEPDDVLDIPAEADPLKTMYVSEDEMRAALGGVEPADDQIMEIPEAAPEPPAFIAPEITPPPSPFAAEAPSEPVFQSSEPAIPSPFEDPAPVVEHEPAPQFTAPEPVFETPQYSEPEPPPFKEPEPVYAPAVMEPMASESPAEWTPPAAPDASWQNQEIGSNTPFQPPPAGTGTENKTLAIISLVVGILSLFCCGWIIPGVIAIVLGFVARSKASSDPANYGGGGLALGGIITGGVSIVLGIIVLILYFLGFAANLMR